MSKKALMMMSSAIAFPLSGASIDLWFASNLIYPSGVFTDYLSCSRASVGYAKNADGTLTQFASNELRIGVGTGLLVEDARKNLFCPSVSDDVSGRGDFQSTHTNNAIN